MSKSIIYHCKNCDENYTLTTKYFGSKFCPNCGKECTELVDDMSKFEKVMTEVNLELTQALNIFSSFKSPHEAIAVIREEYLELETEIFKKKPDMEKVKEEALQLAAMAVRLIYDFDWS